MRDTREYAAAVLVVVMAATLIGWQNYYPNSPMFRSIGVAGPRANAERRCGASYQKRAWGPVQTREVTCRGSGSPLGAWDEQDVELDRLTRRITSARRVWPLADSAAWVAAQDSIQRVLSATGGVVLGCLVPPRQIPGETRTTRAWRFPTYSVRLVAYHWEQARHPDHPRTPSEPPEWMLQLHGYPGDPPDCGPHPTTRYY